VSCILANDGGEAIEILRRDSSFQPDYVFIDINMPRMNGIELLMEIRSHNLIPNSRFIVHSTTITSSTANEFKGLGVEQFAVKPSSIEGMRNLLALMLSV